MQSANDSNTSSRLSNIFGSFCLKVFDAKKHAEYEGNAVDYNALYKSLGAIIQAALESEENSSFITSSKEIIYAMAAIADEVFLSMEWVGKKYWEENMLEQRYFGSQVAGEKIFHQIDSTVTKNEPLSVEKAEIYLKILALGFKGKYREVDNESIAIDSHIAKLSKFIEKNNRSLFLVGNRLFQKEYTYTIHTIHRKFLPDTAIIGYICAFFLFIFLVMSTVVWIFETKDLRRLLGEITQIALRE
ncbi:MAG: DotU family type IV/VI secretion system protein [Holosporaceae bacterium]|jgi:type VI secretion system protein ImpK|nr:DotU family type IV/VI secretion system protein [Holosporaceae bacterium]